METAERVWDSVSSYCENIIEAVGFTPLVRLGRLAQGVKPEVFAKIEWISPTGSLKDRIYAQMIPRAETRGDLRSGMTILECSSGNAGIACAAAAAVKDYDCIIVMPEMMSAERKKNDPRLRRRAHHDARWRERCGCCTQSDEGNGGLRAGAVLGAGRV